MPISGYTSVGVIQDGDLVYLAVDVVDSTDYLDRVASGLTLKRQLGAAGNVTTTDPGAGDDSADGYRAGSLWLNTTDGGLFVCEDASAGAAVWTELAGAGSAGDVSGPASAVDERIAVFDGTTGKLLKDGGVAVAGLATSAQGALADSAVQPDDPISINAQTGTTYTLVLADIGKLVTLSNAGAITLTVPTNASVAFPVGTVIALQQLGVGAITVAGDTGVTINGATPGSEAMTDAQYTSTASLTKHATDTWTLS